MNTDRTIPIRDFPQLRMAARHLPDDALVSREEAEALYNRDWKNIETSTMTPGERTFFDGIFEGQFFYGEGFRIAFDEAAQADDLDAILSFVARGATLPEEVILSAASSGAMTVLSWLLADDRKAEWNGWFWDHEILVEAIDDATSNEQRKAAARLREELSRVDRAALAEISKKQ